MSDTRNPITETLCFGDDGRTPNNRLPVIIHRQTGLVDARKIERRFTANGWVGQWRGGVFDYHHYHSTAHEVLGTAAGEAELTLGGEHGDPVTVRAGDVLVLPAGTGHRRLWASDDFLLVGAYPADQTDWDLCEPGKTDIVAARTRIAALSLPERDPIHGDACDGLTAHWER